MNLLFPLDPDIKGQLNLGSDEELWYNVPFDLDIQKKYLKNSYIAVSTKRLFIIHSGKLQYEVPLEQC